MSRFYRKPDLDTRSKREEQFDTTKRYACVGDILVSEVALGGWRQALCPLAIVRRNKEIVTRTVDTVWKSWSPDIFPQVLEELFLLTGVTLINKFLPGDQSALLARKGLFYIRNKFQLRPASLGGKCSLNDNGRDFHLLSYIDQGIITASFLNIKTWKMNGRKKKKHLSMTQ